MFNVQTVRSLVVPVAVVCFVAAIVVYYLPFILDDSLISLRYAQRLADGDGLSWNDNYFVEGYSNLAWVLLLAGLLELGVEPILSLRLLGLVCCGLVALAFVAIAARSGSWRTMSFLAFLGLGTHPFWIGAIGGLEGPLVVAALFFGLLALDRWWTSGQTRLEWLCLASLLFAVLTLTRPDGPLFVALAAVLPLAGSGPMSRRLRNSAILISVPVVAFVAQMGFRIVYYGDWVPNTARAKISPSVSRYQGGFRYLVWSAVNIAPLLFVCLLLVLWRPQARFATFWLCAAMAAAWSAYLIFIGGDTFAGYRHILPVLAVTLAALVIERDASLLASVENLMRRSGTVTVVIAATAIGAAQLGQASLAGNARAASETWVLECRDVAGALKERFGDTDPLIAVTAAGCLPFWTSFEALDLLGLNDLELPNRKPEGFGRRWKIGHELGDLDYLLERAPEIVVFHIGEGPIFRYRDLIKGDARFDAAYCAISMPVQGSDRLVYLRRDYKAIAAPADECTNVRT